LRSGYISEYEREVLISEISKRVQNAKTFWLFSHENPDGDSLGCCLATFGALRAVGKDVKVLTTEPVARMYRFLPHTDKITYTSELPEGLPDTIIVSDNGSFRRIGREYVRQLTERGIGPLAPVKTTQCTLINIDHHIGNERYGDINLVDPSAAACGELYYHLLRQLRLPFTVDVAVNIYASIMTDTGRFSYANTNRETFRIASELIALGVDPYEVVDRVYNTRTPEQIKLMAAILNTMAVVEDRTYFYCIVTQEMLNATGTEMSDTEGVVDLLKTVADFDLCFLLKEEKDGAVKVSARSNDRFDVNALARRFGGGGHPAAAGFRLESAIGGAPQELHEALTAHRTELAAKKRPLQEPRH
jgi:bifunctional oligoribonuclease and PAP phosphatase NrnA